MVKETKTNPDSYRQEQETPFFVDNDKFAQAITEAGIKAAEATHEFNMREIKAKMLADCVIKLIEKAPTYCNIVQIAEDAKTLVKLTIEKM